MAENMSTFKRFEKKYLLDSVQYEMLLQRISPYTKPDAFDQYTICNIYYDTDDFDIITASLAKPVYKEKLRVRSYGVPNKSSQIFLEIKKKYKGEVFKRRVAMSGHEYEKYLTFGSKPDVSRQVMGEIEYFISLYQPEPKVFLAYERKALSGVDDASLRITFDTNIRFRNQDLSLFNGDSGQRILDDGKCLMEIKVCGAMPFWLCRVLNDLAAYPTSFSKYGHCYQNYMAPTIGVGRMQESRTPIS